MSEIKRYLLVRIIGKFNEQAHMEESNKGNWCAYTDHAAEVERLRGERRKDDDRFARQAIRIQELMGDIERLKAENDELKSEIQFITAPIEAGGGYAASLKLKLAAKDAEIAALKNDLAIKESEHCKDCCCARSWMALGISEYTGKSIPEHIKLLREENAALKQALDEATRMDADPLALVDSGRLYNTGMSPASRSLCDRMFKEEK